MDPSEESFFEILKTHKNQLLVRSDVGCAKGSVRDLPSPDHRYGYKIKKDKESAGSLLSSWQMHSPTKAPLVQKDYNKMNKLGAVSKITKPKQVKNFREKHNFTIKDSRNRLKYAKRLPSEEFVYGIPNKPSTPIKNLVQFEYGNKATSDMNRMYLETRGRSRENPSLKHVPVSRSRPNISQSRYKSKF